MIISKHDIEQLDRIKRLNLINSVTGIKPANLIGTTSEEGELNLAIFSSVVHLGSNPALMGFVLRPDRDSRSDTYRNIYETSEYTINSIHCGFTEQAHWTSVKFDSDISEFARVGLSPEFLCDCKAPFVKESRLKFSLRFRQRIPIPLNHTALIIGEVENIIIDTEDGIDERGYINLESVGSAGISGLNSYYRLEKMAHYPYARINELPEFYSVG